LTTNQQNRERFCTRLAGMIRFAQMSAGCSRTFEATEVAVLDKAAVSDNNRGVGLPAAELVATTTAWRSTRPLQHLQQDG
jgi:hypothetical protein